MTAWRCYARPAWQSGKECGHVNPEHECDSRGLVCCAQCGCTKIASEARRLKRHVGQQALDLVGRNPK